MTDFDDILERVQAEGDIEDITPEEVNKFLRNTGATTSTWKEYREDGRLRTRTRDTQGWSTAKDNIAKELGAISQMYKDAADYKNIDDVRSKFKDYTRSYSTLTQSNIDMMQARLDVGDTTDRAVALITDGKVDQASEIRDIFRQTSDTGKDYIAAQINNEWRYAGRSNPIKQAS